MSDGAGTADLDAPAPARAMQGNRPRWDEDGRDWPLREASRFVDAAGLRWHVQQLGTGPALLLLHGTGAATHTWRGLAPLLARHFTLIAPDLPGHGFTGDARLEQLSLPGMALALGALLRALDARPVLVVGHSAGAAIAARMALDGSVAPAGLVSLNGAFLPLPGLPGLVFSPLAKLLALNPLVPRFFAWRGAERTAVQRLIDGTGSTLDAAGLELYGRLIRRPGHVAGALGMMANWDLAPLARDLPRLNTPLLLVTGSHDRTIAPSETGRVQARLPAAEAVSLPGLGHLAHEEQPAAIAAPLIAFARRVGALPAAC